MEIFEMEKEFNDLMKKGQELIEKMKKEQVADATKTKRWKPKCGEYYCTIEWNGRVNSYNWDNDLSDCNCFILGNCFKTHEEAEKELDRRIVEQELLDMCDFDGRVELCYDEHSECFEADDSSELPYYHSPYRFSSKESCEKAIEQLGEDKLKLIFRIKD